MYLCLQETHLCLNKWRVNSSFPFGGYMNSKDDLFPSSHFMSVKVQISVCLCDCVFVYVCIFLVVASVLEYWIKGYFTFFTYQWTIQAFILGCSSASTHFLAKEKPISEKTEVMWLLNQSRGPWSELLSVGSLFSPGGGAAFTESLWWGFAVEC